VRAVVAICSRKVAITDYSRGKRGCKQRLYGAVET
jgi:hypothetical protein